MKSIDFLGKFQDAINESGLPGSANELLVFYVMIKDENFILTIKDHPGVVVFSSNDITLKYFDRLSTFSDVIEICNPYDRYEFAIIKFKDFSAILKKLFKLQKVSKVEALTKDPMLRSDYQESKDHWKKE